ncbi:Coiled-coil domain-containing protein 115 [Takifugu flavidus]|uniref:Coiled-coil domain-containing protein 115 n=1 Tax=Takifugu flavidus TaxID=433684 RepID=A0A5C6MTG8_9TELE|nr:Coiled-coil domain-containing protein 115 [Takifugu flavidus]
MGVSKLKSSVLLDEELLRFMELLELLEEKRTAFNSLIEQGWFSISKARYSMGNKQVSALQYASEIEPLVHVHTRTLDNGGVDFHTERVQQNYSNDTEQDARSVEDIGPQEEVLELSAEIAALQTSVINTRQELKRLMKDKRILEEKRKHQAMYDDFVKRKDMKREGYPAGSLHSFTTNGGNTRYTLPIAAAGGAVGAMGSLEGGVGGSFGGGVAKFDRHDPRQPVSIVENKGFRELLQLLEPRYTPERQHYIQSQLLPAYAYQAQLATRQALTSAHALSLSLDLWQGLPGATSGYLGVTCHFLTADWQMQSALLACLPLTEGSSGSRVLADFDEFSSTLAKAACFYNYITSAVPPEKLSQVFDRPGNAPPTVRDWAAQLKVLRRMLDSVDFLEDLSSPEELALGGSERTLLRELTDILEPFTEAWDMVHGDRESDIHTERHVSISLALPCVLGLRKHLSETSMPNCPSLVVGLTQALESWLAPILEDPLYITATTLDPQFKLTWSSNPDWHRQVLIEELHKQSTVYRPTEANTEQNPQSQTPPTPSPSPVSTLSRPCKLFSFIKQRPTMQAKSLEQELAIYLREEPTEEEALHYWQRKAIDFPLLSQVAKRAFTIPACGTVVESIFNTARYSLQPRRGHIVPKNLETLIYLKANYRLLWT